MKYNKHGLPILDSNEVKRRKIAFCKTEKCIGVAIQDGLCEQCYLDKAISQSQKKVTARMEWESWHGK